MPLLLLLCLCGSLLNAQTIAFPERPSSALSGSAAAAGLIALGRQEREERIFFEIMSGNVPSFQRTAVPVTDTVQIAGVDRTVTIFVLPDYLCIGNDSDYFYVPMTPLLAQRLADTLRSILPTARMVDRIYRRAAIKLRPQPIPPDTLMTGMPRFIQHNDSVRTLLPRRRSGVLTAGHKKDIILHAKIYSELRPHRPRPVVIYGWHRSENDPIQPPNNWHQETYVDYSHGVRLIAERGLLDGKPVLLKEILRDEQLYHVLSETPLPRPYYETEQKQ